MLVTFFFVESSKKSRIDSRQWNQLKSIIVYKTKMMVSPRQCVLSIVSTLLIVTVLISSGDCFMCGLPGSSCKNRAHSTKLNFFGGLAGAFANDDKLGKAQDAGLSNGPNTNDKVTINGKAVKAIVGQRVSVVAATARVKIKYDCKNGDCGTCLIKMNGKKVKACQQVIPSGSCAIDTTS